MYVYMYLVNPRNLEFINFNALYFTIIYADLRFRTSNADVLHKFDLKWKFIEANQNINR